MVNESYYDIARQNEGVFRNVLRDLRDNREERPMGHYIPKDLATEATLEEIFDKYSRGMRFGIFTITNFTRPEKDVATIAFESKVPLAGGDAELEYLVRDNGSVSYNGLISWGGS